MASAIASNLNRANECFRREEFASSMTDLTLTERTRRVIDCGALVVLGFVALAILSPLQNAPFIDDATYAWSVEWLLQRGELRILDWATSLNLTQFLWGWLFCLPGGFSFSALRFSTLVTRAKRGVRALFVATRTGRRTSPRFARRRRFGTQPDFLYPAVHVHDGRRVRGADRLELLCGRTSLAAKE